MPKNKFQDAVFTVIMVIVMVYAIFNNNGNINSNSMFYVSNNELFWKYIL